MTLACEDANSKLVQVVTVADVDVRIMLSQVVRLVLKPKLC